MVAENLDMSANVKETNKVTPYTVSQLTHEIKSRLENFHSIWLSGEISNLKYHSSKHIYLTLKDSENQIAAVIWRSTAKDLQFELHDGMEVLVSGELTVYGPKSTYQITINTIEPRGLGALLLAFEKLKTKLSQLGLFAPEHKKPLPAMPRKICVVTSPTGAAIQDILNVIERRFPLVKILIYPVRVQGENAHQQIADAIRFVNRHPALSDVEVMIVGRGGGTLEDLWAFNEESVAYAIFESRIPIISAVGHEINVTIADLVADRRALTPTEAGEIVVPRLDQVYQSLQNKKNQLSVAIYHRMKICRSSLSKLSTHRAFTRPLEKIRHVRQKLDIFNQRLRSHAERMVQHKHLLLAQSSGKLLSHQPAIRLQRYEQRLEELKKRITTTMCNRIQSERHHINNYEAQLEALSPLSVLRRGYSITYNYTGESVVRDQTHVTIGERIWTRLANSWVLSRVEKTGTKSGEKKN